jgi:hypothetical protein
LKFVWDNIIINFYRERKENPETRALVVVKAKQLEVKKFEDDFEIGGTILDFFPLTGDIDYVSSDEGLSDKYVLCWLDEEDNELIAVWRGKINGVTFPTGMTFTADKNGKRLYNAHFKAKY